MDAMLRRHRRWASLKFLCVEVASRVSRTIEMRGGLAPPFAWGSSMLKHVLVLVFVFVAAGLFGPPPVKAQTAAPAQAAAPPFNPGFADLMNTLVQPRHAKLG
jgi:hypothetical protein